MNTIKKVAAFVVLSTGVAAESSIADFMNYCSKHSKSYNTMEEFKLRFELFQQAEIKIQEHSQKNGSGYQMGHT